MTPPGSTDLAAALASAEAHADVHADMSGPRAIVLAVDGGADNDHAIDIARALSEKSGATINVVSVAELAAMPVDAPPFMVPPVNANPDIARATQLGAVRMQLARRLGAGVEWSVALRTGIMGIEVAEFAKSSHADIIIVGRGRHGVIDRLLGEEHLARLLRATEVPVLAAEPALRIPAQRVVIGVDFGAHSVGVARATAPYIAANAAVCLVHVKPDPPFGIPHPGQWLQSYEDGVRAGLDRLRGQIALPDTCAVETVVLNGHPGVALAEFARATRSDLVAVGVQGSGFWNRLVIGSVTTHLLRAATCSLLAIPVKST